MRSVVEAAVNTYIRMVSEPDPGARAALLESCFAENGRIVSRNREIRGRGAIGQEISRFLADPGLLRVRILSVIDAGETTFRFRSLVERRDGTSAEFFDAGEVDATGRIAVIFTFAGPLAALADES